MSDDIDTFKMLAYVAITAGSFAVYSVRQIKKKTKMQNMAKQMLSSAGAGSVEVEVIAWPLKAVGSSMSGEKTVFRFMELKKRVKRGKNSEWITVWTKYTTEPFLIFDHSGYAVVEPNDNGKLDAFSEGLISNSFDPFSFSPLQNENFTEFYDGSVDGFSSRLKGVGGFFSGLLSSHYRLYERIIPIGSPLLIHGFFHPHDTSKYVHIKDEFKLFKERAAKLITNKNYRVSLFDKNKNGSINREELTQGFQSAVRSSIKTDFSITDFKDVGTSQEKLYGTITASEHEELSITSGFEEQILNDNPIYLNWLCLYLSAGILAFSIIFYMIM